MEVEFNGVITAFDKIPPGGFFMFDLMTVGAFGLCVEFAQKKNAAISFPTAKSKDRLGWIQSVGLQPQTFIHFPKAVLRPAMSSAIQAGAAAPGASLICEGKKRFIRGHENQGYHFTTFNIETGLVETPAGQNTVYFTGWSVGHVLGDRFDPIYSYPPATQAA
ncbi:hypothetical protein [Bradyrhizobium sp. Mp64]|uniref:hypothetical protein n=1 Tax=Bradyrhizobium sp. Mp64 TaxID=3042158 RepID=UPI00248B93E4|nr:hypothetical protein [Bradyrhizobium sp. Mp64]MDI2103943.1 hypothetical protein [Bradyrhizobium sp. Mp64]